MYFKFMTIILFMLFCAYEGCENFDNWLKNGNFNYYISNYESDFTDAQECCLKNGGNLSSITTAEEWEFLANHIDGHDSWIGLRINGETCTCDGVLVTSQSCLECRKRWVWIDGSRMLDNDNNLIFNQWANSEPDHSYDRCARALPSGEWRNKACDNEYQYICKTATVAMTTENAMTTIKLSTDQNSDVTKTSGNVVPTNGISTPSDDVMFSTENHVTTTNAVTTPSDDALVTTEGQVATTNAMTTPSDDVLVTTVGHVITTNAVTVPSDDLLVTTESQVTTTYGITVPSDDTKATTIDGTATKSNDLKPTTSPRETTTEYVRDDCRKQLRRINIKLERDTPNYIPTLYLIRYDCPEGFAFIDDSATYRRAVCQANGTWIPSLRQCFENYNSEKADVGTKEAKYSPYVGAVMLAFVLWEVVFLVVLDFPNYVTAVKMLQRNLCKKSAANRRKKKTMNSTLKPRHEP